MQICIHQKDNSSKPVNHRLTLKEWPKVKSNNRRFLAQDFVLAGFALLTSRIYNKRVISTFNFGYPCLTLKEGPRSNPTTPKDSQLMISCRLVYHPKILGPIISEL